MSFQTPIGQCTTHIEGLGTLDGFEYPKAKQFCGIPYAILPKRWTRSYLNTSWPGQYHDGTMIGNDCPRPGFDEGENTILTPVPPQQHFPARPKQDELTALVMNIVVPKVSQIAQVPVMIYVHGGSLLYGGANLPIFDAVNLVSHSVAIGKPTICVNFNYRVGLGGFLASSAIARELRADGHSGCGNFGFTDQQVAFEWVQKYIDQLGGDAHNVTAVGESAGGISISNQLLAAHPPKFNRAVCMSGLAVSIPAWTMQQHEALFEATCTYFDLDPRGSEVLQKLRQIPEAELAEATPKIQGVASGTGNPCLDGWFYAKDALAVHAAPSWLDAYMIGDVYHEGVIFHENILRETYESVYSTLLSIMQDESHVRSVMKAYGITRDQPPADLLEALEDMAGDAVFKMPNFATVKANSRLEKDRKLFFYHFDQRSRLANELEGTAYHAYELLFLFGNLRNRFSESECRLADAFASAWVAFVHGDAPWDGPSPKCKVWGPDCAEVVVDREEDEHVRRYQRMEQIMTMDNGATWKKWLHAVDAMINQRWNMYRRN